MKQPPPHPSSAYGVDKLSTELHAKIATEIHNIPTIGLRFFNVYGPRQDPHSQYSGVISKFFEKARIQKSFIIYGDGEQTRDFIYVKDVVSALITVLERNIQIEHEIYNVCTNISSTVHMIANTISALYKIEPHYFYSPAKPGDIRHSVGDASKIRKKLNFKATYSLTKGLTELFQTIQHLPIQSKQHMISSTASDLQTFA